ncbi:MAG TPA: ABC transporter ATP-binding protein [Bryobacteraceae bacterium]|jgi:sodium transport system ATP-binding protein|nr:ABC transporter ATP-binding protein [Bryobacteraceae bacterium]
MIQVSGLSKVFSDSKHGTRLAVDDVSFEVRAGEVFGLLGPNGAGKTTTLRMLSTLLKPSSGTATLNGFEITREPQKVREQIGFLLGDMGLYLRLTPIEILNFFGKLNGMDAGQRATRIERLMTMLDMKSFAGIRTDKLSTGMKQKTAIARTMLHDPPILILDEPTSGLDVPTARAIETSIVEAKSAGKCVLYSTHVMEEAEYLCDRIGVISDGKMKMVGTMEELRAATGKQRLREIFLDLLGLEQ